MSWLLLDISSGLHPWNFVVVPSGFRISFVAWSLSCWRKKDSGLRSLSVIVPERWGCPRSSPRDLLREWSAPRFVEEVGLADPRFVEEVGLESFFEQLIPVLVFVS